MDNTKVYDKYNWDNITYAHLEGKIKRVTDWIPEDVKTIADIGCGNGVITNILGEKYEVTGIDRSEIPLESVKTKKLAASADGIPLPDNSFDLVFSSELLEHLPDEVLKGAVAEMKRLSKKYVFITVPNDENPDKLSIQCPSCKYVYNSPNHLRSFRKKDFKKLFPEYSIIDNAADGNKVRYYHPAILKLKKKLTPAASWIPKYWMEESKRQTVCPNCEHEFSNPYRFNLLSLGFDILNVLISPKKPYWLFVLMEKKS
jgi:ubiquinone/menaquinone biosynthesis C-methylase UbiE